SGGLDIAGLEWLGARAYDPATRAFLSTDPLAPVLGAGWDGNPYAYAGNNPINTTDPTGLRPLTDDELKAYDGSSRAAFAAAGDWLGDNWEYIAGGAMVIAGGVLMATGVGGPAGMVLIAAGADTIIQKATTGGVNWGQVALSGALGGFGGASIAARAGLCGMKATLVAGASSGGISGGIQSSYGYYSGPGPHTISGAVGATAQGTVFGAALGGAGGAGGHAAVQAINRFRLRGQFGPINPGPLPQHVAETFRSASYHRVRASEPVDLYRVYGGQAGPVARYWSRDIPTGPLQAQLDSALIPAWGNTATEVSHIRVPAGTRFYEGSAAQQPLGGTAENPWEEAFGSLSGGGNQVYINGMVSDEWIVK
ncbi:RHS repeat-associated core domain-containing protein, partial [Pseudarthrobacter sp. B907]|uniref:RHS repeat-associated core domain-containing protein n=1 Tax=Pseudarthrobacter sp. B907 TaxID=3158261 RepID=UPI0032DA911A